MDFLQTIEKNRELFLRYNGLKFQRFQQLISSVVIRRTLNLLPFLLCVNSPKIPGYVEGDVPVGLCNYTIDDDTKKFIRSKYPQARMDISRISPFVEMLAVMGSVGTVAYNKKSDFDYWVCVNRNSVTPEQFRNFKEKVERIQKWIISEIEVPVHLFINDVESIKNNIFAEDEEEMFGSTVGAVLKDEFLRSSIIIAGKIPFWWVLPMHVRDFEYDELYKKLPEEMKGEFIDLGNLYEISREDFLGAALFQIIKSLGNPFKSIIKIGVLEKYIFGKGDSPLLSQKIKLNIHRSNLESTVLDSYLFMFQEVYDYYNATLDDPEMVNILKKNLYLKVDPQISKYTGVKDRKNIPDKVVVMMGYVKDWGWDIGVIRELDGFDEWDFNRVMAFWDLVKRFMLLSYQKITAQLPVLKLEKKISETDFMLLSRKIKTHFSREQDKIDNFITFKDTPSEAILYIEPMSRGVQDGEWRLYKRIKSEQDTFTTTTLRFEKSLIRLLTWMSVNQIYDPVFSRLNIQSGYTRINQTLVTGLLNQVHSLFSAERTKIKNAYYMKPAFALVNMVIINFNRENIDAVQTIHHLYFTSWGESYLKEYNSEDDLARILHSVIKDGLNLKAGYDDYCVINTPEPFKKSYKRIGAIFREAYTFIVQNNRANDARFVTQIGEKSILINKEGPSLTASVYPGIFNLLTAVTLRPLMELKYAFFSDESAPSSLGLIYSVHQKDSISMVYEEGGEHLIIYVINEKGNVFTFIRNKRQGDLNLIYLYDFCKNIIKRINETGTAAPLDVKKLKVYNLRNDRAARSALADESLNLEAKYLRNFKSTGALTVGVSRHMGEEPFYNVAFPDGVSSGLMSIKDVQVVNDKVSALRNEGRAVNGVFRDVFFTDLKAEDKNWGSTPYILEKYKLEFVLSR